MLGGHTLSNQHSVNNNGQKQIILHVYIKQPFLLVRPNRWYGALFCFSVILFLAQPRSDKNYGAICSNCPQKSHLTLDK